MSPGNRIVVTGTDTDIGKTVFAAGLTRFLNGCYWKPIQAGLEGESDSSMVRRLSGLPADRIIPERWRLSTPASPHLSAQRDGVCIDTTDFEPPSLALPLIIEGAGGLMVPLNDSELYIDVFARWRVPVVLCARTSLGTLNHTLLSLEALRNRNIAVLGVALIGAAHEDNERTLSKLGGALMLGRLPMLQPLDADTLAAAFGTHFRRESFTS